MKSEKDEGKVRSGRRGITERKRGGERAGGEGTEDREGGYVLSLHSSYLE